MAVDCSFEVTRRSDGQVFTWVLGEYTALVSEAFEGQVYANSKAEVIITDGTKVYDFAVDDLGTEAIYDLPTEAYFKIKNLILVSGIKVTDIQ